MVVLDEAVPLHEAQLNCVGYFGCFSNPLSCRNLCQSTSFACGVRVGWGCIAGVFDPGVWLFAGAGCALSQTKLCVYICLLCIFAHVHAEAAASLFSSLLVGSTM